MAQPFTLSSSTALQSLKSVEQVPRQFCSSVPLHSFSFLQNAAHVSETSSGPPELELAIAELDAVPVEVVDVTAEPLDAASAEPPAPPAPAVVLAWVAPPAEEADVVAPLPVVAASSSLLPVAHATNPTERAAKPSVRTTIVMRPERFSSLRSRQRRRASGVSASTARSARDFRYFGGSTGAHVDTPAPTMMKPTSGM